MTLAADIVKTYRAPRRVLRRRLQGSAREGRALAIVLLACLVMFAAQWPVLARLTQLDPTVPFPARIGGALLSWLFIAPLGLYATAAISHALARPFGGRASWFEARMALFWALLATGPLWLINGLAAGFAGPGATHSAAGLVALLAFFVFWGAGLWEVERKGEAGG